ncbi:MAG: competence/damage-inducible protein A [Bacillati bacterium ANGP1]|uniref:CinA-like protein n=2 Tax=Candidatus Segetimicrobium genomatis TaxID=2569760 RepID=A0A537JH13_9BACT|nr:MAG: competence/damage-inducible protein A [Terrabacteria group bacterium ANGP1]
MTRAEIISVGTEHLLGQIVDTNATFLCTVLAELGIAVYFRSTVGDNVRRVQDVFRHALARADLILATGGLGPTDDDLTVAAVAEALGLPLERNEEAWAHVQEFFRKRKRPLSEQQEKQAMMPRGSRMIPNPRGSAPGVIIEHRDKTIIFTPGVPREMKGMVEDSVVPYLRERGLAGREVIRSRVLRITGLGESAVEDRLRDLMRSSVNPTIAPYAHTGECHVRVTARGGDAEVEAMLARAEAAIRERLGNTIYAADQATLEEVVAKALATKRVSIAVAESCTAGLLGHRLTGPPGASAFLDGGIITYSAARAMAESVRRQAGTDLGIATTGIAGPTGGTPAKPVGLVYLALAHAGGTEVREIHVGTEPGRAGVKYLASQAALDMIRLHLLR